MNSKIIFSFLFGLFIGFGVGYVITDLHYRKIELKTPENIPHQSQSPMDEVHRQLSTFQEILKRNPDDWDALVGTGNLYYDIGQYEKAIPYYERAINIKKDPDVISDLGTCNREIGKPVEAVRLYEEVLKLDPKHWRSVYNIIIVSINDFKDKKKALKYFEELKKLNPQEINLDALSKEIEKLN